MSIWTRIKSNFWSRRTLSLTDPAGWEGLGVASDSGETITETSALAISAVWACTNLIAGSIASLPLMVYRRASDGTKTEARDHPLFRLLHESPNADQTALEFFEAVVFGLELWGNAYARKGFNSRGELVALTPIAPALMQVRRTSSGAIHYRWEENGKGYEGEDGEILHFRGFGGSPLGGLSTLSFARNSFGLARAIDRSAASTFRNGLRPSGALTFSEWLSAEQREVAEKKLAEKYLGAVNSGRPLILEGGTKWEPFTINPEDAQMLDSRRFSVEEICRFFGVPPHMVGHTEKSTSWGTGLEQQTLAFQKFTLRVRLKRIEQALAKQLLTAADRVRGVSLEFNLEGLLRGDSAARAAFYNAGLQYGWLTINEVRGKESLPPVEGGEVPRMQMQNVPITEAGNGIS